MFKDRTIERRVMASVRSAIEEAQANFEHDVEAAEARLEADIAKLHDAHGEHIDGLVETHVTSVFSKLK